MQTQDNNFQRLEEVGWRCDKLFGVFETGQKDVFVDGFHQLRELGFALFQKRRKSAINIITVFVLQEVLQCQRYYATSNDFAYHVFTLRRNFVYEDLEILFWYAELAWNKSEQLLKQFFHYLQLGFLLDYVQVVVDYWQDLVQQVNSNFVLVGLSVLFF